MAIYRYLIKMLKVYVLKYNEQILQYWYRYLGAYPCFRVGFGCAGGCLWSADDHFNGMRMGLAAHQEKVSSSSPFNCTHRNSEGSRSSASFCLMWEMELEHRDAHFIPCTTCTHPFSCVAQTCEIPREDDEIMTHLKVVSFFWYGTKVCNN